MQRVLKATDKNDREKFLLVSFCVVLFLPAINNFINCFFQNGLDKDLPYVTEVSYILMVLFGVVSALRCFTKNRAVFFISVLIIVGCWLSYFIYPDMRAAIYDNPVDLIYNPINKVTFFCIPALIYTFQIRDYEKLFDMMGKWSRITLIIGAITFYYVYFIADEKLQYMVFSYFMLTPICFLFETYLHARKISDLFFCILGFFAILLCGARGAILSFLLYLVIRVFSYKGTSVDYSKIVVKFLFSVILLFIALFWGQIIDILYNFTTELGIESRFITALVEGTLNKSNSRNIIAQAVLEGIENNPFGYGIFGDRYSIGIYSLYDHTYAHNFFLEIFGSFGIVAGFFFIIVFLHSLIKATKRENAYYNGILWSLIPYGFFQLFFSSSATENYVFYMICALIFSKKVKEDKDEDCRT